MHAHRLPGLGRAGPDDEMQRILLSSHPLICSFLATAAAGAGRYRFIVLLQMSFRYRISAERAVGEAADTSRIVVYVSRF